MRNLPTINPSEADDHRNLSDAEVLMLLDEAKQQYEEYSQIIRVTRMSRKKKVWTPKYSWDNPIGLEFTRDPMPSWSDLQGVRACLKGHFIR